MRWRGLQCLVLILLALTSGATAPGCAPSGPAVGPVWLITLERGADSEGDVDPGEDWPAAIAADAARFPRGHAVSPVPVTQWSSLWTGYWPRTLEGADLGRVPSLLRDLRSAGHPVRAWLPELPLAQRDALSALGLESWDARRGGSNASADELAEHWSAACSLWERWCADGTPGLLWLHLDGSEAARFGELLGLAGGSGFAGPATRSGHVWAVELGGPPDPRAAAALAGEPWTRLGDLEERRLATRAWAWSAELAGADRPWCTHDLAPTLAACLGLPEPFTEDQAAALGGADPGYRVLVGERRGTTHRRQVAWVGDLKLWRAAQPLAAEDPAADWSGDHPRLFDWRLDPAEAEDLGPGNADRVLQLENVFRLWENQRLVRRRAARRLGWLLPAETGS
ncbi:MAG: hypothetical protein ACYS26_03070 [Planctomycetota bacterium]|jgi:hypothetical protein